MAKRKILVLENSIAVTGALKAVVRSSLHLRSNIEFIFVLPSKSSALAYVSNFGFTCHEIPMQELSRSIRSWLMYFPALVRNLTRLKRLIAKEKIDLVHVNDFYNLLPAFGAIFGNRTPYVCHVRFLSSRFPSLLVRSWSFLQSRYAKQVIAVSEAAFRELPYRKNAVIIHDKLPEFEIAFTAPISNTILYPANYIEGKGHVYALESFSRLNMKYPEWKLRFVGSDMGLEKNTLFKKSLMARSRALQIDRQVEWADFADDITQEYQAASVILNFSEAESFSLTCLEAMYCGRAVVATACGGPQEIIEHNSTGMLVAVKGITEMTDAIDSLLSSAERRKQLGHNAYLAVRDKFNDTNTIKRLEQVYFRVINGII